MDLSTCPICGEPTWRDSVDVGVGIMYGPYGCPCGWSEDPAYDLRSGPRRTDKGYVIDQWGGLTPAHTVAEFTEETP